MPPRGLSAKQEAFIVAFIADPEHNAPAAAKVAGYTAKNEHTRLLKQPTIAARIKDWQEAKIAAAVGVSEIDTAARVRILEDQARRILSVIDARSIAYAGIVGGGSGMIVKRIRYYGSGDDVKMFEEHSMDNATNKELRETLKQIAIERGEWTEKSEQKVTAVGGGQIIINEISVQPTAAPAIEANGRVLAIDE